MPELGQLIAKGRAADVYDYGEGLILRRYRTDHDCLYEAAVMQHVHAHGYPVPEVVEVSGRDIVMERIDGPTMLADFGKHPWLVFRHARTLADLLKRLHSIPAPPWLRPKLGGTGDALVHLDIHPDNVMLSSRGPIVIDWSNAGRGIPEAEVADLWLIMANAKPPANRLERILIQLGRRLLVSAFLKKFDRDAIRRRLEIAAEHRLRDRNMSEQEKQRIRRFVAKWKL
jgi:aminoglycoside phosphotransferase (APT) family kinase protein